MLPLQSAAVKDIGDRVGITVARYDFSEPQQGKVVCDRVLFQNIKQFSELHNFRYEESEIRV